MDNIEMAGPYSAGACEVEDELLNTCSKPLNLTDLNEYCKIKIFEHLEWSDLLNTAETCKLLKSSVCDVFKRKYGNGYLALRIDEGLIMTDRVDVVRLMDRSTTLKVLRNFGSTVSNVDVTCARASHDTRQSSYSAYFNRLEWYLQEYCLESLEKITLRLIEPNRKMAFEATAVQFPNVKEVETHYCYFGDHFSFNANFPNVQKLTLTQAKCTFSVKDWHFPTVTDLHYNPTSTFSMVDLIEMLKRHQQLQKLGLHFLHYTNFHPDLAKCINEFLPNLQKLNLTIHNFRPTSLELVHFEHVTDFSLCVWYIELRYMIPFTFNRLERFEMLDRSIRWLDRSIRRDADSAAHTLEFISKNKHLKTIHLEGIKGNYSQLFEIEHILSNVEEIRICTFQKISSDVIERFLRQSRSLKELRICRIDDITNALESKISEKKVHPWDKKNLEFIFRLSDD